MISIAGPIGLCGCGELKSRFSRVFGYTTLRQEDRTCGYVFGINT